jgi:hypothetical protein
MSSRGKPYTFHRLRSPDWSICPAHGRAFLIGTDITPAASSNSFPPGVPTAPQVYNQKSARRNDRPWKSGPGALNRLRDLV